jgi:3-oxoacyl-[acyl-carrier-protein] synthase III
MNSRIEEISVYLPEKIESNEELALDFPDANIKKIENIVGIKQRHIAGENETALDIAYQAGKILLKKVDGNKIDFILFCSQSPDYFLPASACILQDRLGLKKSIGAYDFSLGCTGFIFGLATARPYSSKYS